MSLNQLPPEGSMAKSKLCVTDTRLRPDQRLLEEGETDAAQAEKLRLEVVSCFRVSADLAMIGPTAQGASQTGRRAEGLEASVFLVCAHKGRRERRGVAL